MRRAFFEHRKRVPVAAAENKDGPHVGPVLFLARYRICLSGRFLYPSGAARRGRDKQRACCGRAEERRHEHRLDAGLIAGGVDVPVTGIDRAVRAGYVRSTQSSAGR